MLLCVEAVQKPSCEGPARSDHFAQSCCGIVLKVTVVLASLLLELTAWPVRLKLAYVLGASNNLSAHARCLVNGRGGRVVASASTARDRVRVS